MGGSATRHWSHPVAEPQRVRLLNRQRRLKVDRAPLCALADDVLRGEGVAAQTEVTVVLVRDGAMAELNARFRDRPRTTDVLAFPTDSSAWPEEMPSLLGEVVVSTDRAAAQAAERGIAPARELARLVVHGLLHLLGYDDQTPRDRARMRRREDRYLEGWSEPRRR
ncbi:MAG: rRNA maturation RNase YbeY [Candidatus Eisenbacteria bacterium]|nr:rRNA maturation RNase YbeY [Candidatus Eisenbacteria bacterium]